jgi:hypothetical protein
VVSFTPLPRALSTALTRVESGDGSRHEQRHYIWVNKLESEILHSQTSQVVTSLKRLTAQNNVCISMLHKMGFGNQSVADISEQMRRYTACGAMIFRLVDLFFMAFLLS